MQKTTAQSQQESQKTRARLVLFWKTFYKKKKKRTWVHLMSLAQDNGKIYQITSPTTCNLHAYRQASELRLNSFFISTTLFSFEQLIHLDYFIWRRVGWWRDGFLVASWWRNSLVARWPDTVTRDRDNKAHTHTHTIHIYLPFTRKSKDENRKMWKLKKNVQIVAAEISPINSVPVRIKFSRELTLSKTRPSSDVWNCEHAKT